jgi:hypothetical protein
MGRLGLVAEPSRLDAAAFEQAARKAEQGCSASNALHKNVVLRLTASWNRSDLSNPYRLIVTDL